MKLTSLLQKLLFVPVLLGLTVVLATGCSDDDDELQGGGNGYVQFKLYKEASYGESASRASDSELEYLYDAKKVKVVLTSNGVTSSYTLPVSAYNAENAEYGMRSEKLELVAGAYQLIGFYLYDKVEKEIYAGEPAAPTSFMVERGGLCIQDLLVNVVPRGQVRFHLVKDLSAVSRTGSRADLETKYYPFSSVARVTFDVKNMDTKKVTHIENVDVEVEDGFHEDNSETSYAVLDSLITLEAGRYTVTEVWTSDKNKTTLEVGVLKEGTEFTVYDNQNPEAQPVEIPLTLQESADYIKDYIALKEIWLATGGETDWYYVGENYPKGVNWNFDKDIDMWGEQPGVNLNAEGRVISLSIGEFSPKGKIPAALGQLTALQTLYLGTHNDKQHPNVPNGSSVESRKKFAQAMMNPTAENLKILRNDYMDNYASHDIRADFSEPLLWGFKERGIEVKKQNKPASRDINWGELTNGITGIDEAIGNLENLEILYIANSKVAELPATIGNLKKCTDMELYNNPLMKEFPDVLAEMPELIQLNIAMNKQWSSEEINAGLEKLCGGKSQATLQVLYMGFNNATRLPENVKNLKKLGKIDCAYNKLTGTLPRFEGINLVQATFDYNQIEAIPDNFCGIEDVESITFSNNKIKNLPTGFFNPKSVYVMVSVDFSGNEITEVPANYGANVSTLSLARNKLTKFPKGLFQGGSVIESLNLSGNLISSFEEGDIVGEKSYMLASLDLTYNRLSDFPTDFNAINVPYLYGVDVSFNCFSEFPFEPFNVDRLTVFAIRGQRDADGNRTLKEWPLGVGKHKGLRALYLGSNDIGDVNVGQEEQLSYLIYNLDISDNPNIVINMAELCPYIQAGMFMLIYDQTQDIRGCDVLFD